MLDFIRDAFYNAKAAVLNAVEWVKSFFTSDVVVSSEEAPVVEETPVTEPVAEVVEEVVTEETPVVIEEVIEETAVTVEEVAPVVLEEVSVELTEKEVYFNNQMKRILDTNVAMAKQQLRKCKAMPDERRAILAVVPAEHLVTAVSFVGELPKPSSIAGKGSLVGVPGCWDADSDTVTELMVRPMIAILLKKYA